MTAQVPDPDPTPTGPDPVVPPQRPDAPEAKSAPRPGLDDRGHVKRTRAGSLWFATVVMAVVTVAFVVFVAQNSENATVRYLGWSGELPLVAIVLIAGVAGALLVAVPAGIRIVQLRRALRKSGTIER